VHDRLLLIIKNVDAKHGSTYARMPKAKRNNHFGKTSPYLLAANYLQKLTEKQRLLNLNMRRSFSLQLLPPS